MGVDVARTQGPPRGGGGGAPATPPTESWWVRLVTFYHGVVAEMRKVTWPDRGQVRSATVAIIVFVLLLGLFIFLMDGALQAILLRLIPSLFGGG